jgi:hypothetical protein
MGSWISELLKWVECVALHLPVQFKIMGVQFKIMGVSLGGGPTGQGPVVPLQARHTWRLHIYGGTFHLLPQPWQFLSCTPLQSMEGFVAW